MHIFPHRTVDDRRMFGLVPLLLMTQLSQVGTIVQQFLDEALVDGFALAKLAIL